MLIAHIICNKQFAIKFSWQRAATQSAHDGPLLSLRALALLQSGAKTGGCGSGIITGRPSAPYICVISGWVWDDFSGSNLMHKRQAEGTCTAKHLRRIRLPNTRVRMPIVQHQMLKQQLPPHSSHYGRPLGVLTSPRMWKLWSGSSNYRQVVTNELVELEK